MSKIDDLMRIEGYDDYCDFLNDSQDSINCGICMNKDCNYTTNNVEPDCDSGYCEECKTYTVKSASELLFFHV